MPKVLRKYEHIDFSGLLNELHSPAESRPMTAESSAKQKAALPVAEVSRARRRRDSLLSNRKMRYAYSEKDLILHDRSCPKIAGISDEDFQMRTDFAWSMKPCKECLRRSLLRIAIADDDAKYIAAYENIFNAMGATTEDIQNLVVTHKAQIRDVTLYSVRIKVRDDNWIVQVNQGKLYLYHNNYEVLENYERIIRPQYHFQQCSGGAGAYHCIIGAICNYSWPAHVSRMIEQERQRKRELLRARLAGISNAVQLKRFSLLYKYYTVVDCNNKAQKYCKKQKVRLAVEGGDTGNGPYRTIVCRVRRWEDKRFCAAMENLKEYSITSDHWDYADRCIAQLKP